MERSYQTRDKEAVLSDANKCRKEKKVTRTCKARRAAWGKVVGIVSESETAIECTNIGQKSGGSSRLANVTSSLGFPEHHE
jgi:hypothetical protein